MCNPCNSHADLAVIQAAADSSMLHQSDELLSLFCHLFKDAHLTKAPSTINSYLPEWTRFENFMRRHAPACMHWSKANGATVAVFLTQIRLESAYRQIGDSAVKKASAAIACKFTLSGLISPTDHPLCAIARSEAARTLRSTPLQRDELTVAHIHILAAKYVFPGCDLRVRMHVTCMVLSFAAFLRYDDLAKVLVHHQLLQICPTHMYIFLYKSKTDRMWEGSWVAVARLQPPSLCPVKLVEDLLAVGGYVTVPREVLTTKGVQDFEDVGPLLRRTSSPYNICTKLHKVTSSIRDPIPPLGYDSYRRSIKQLAAAAGIREHILPHSARIGGATAAANLGVPDRLFKAHGRWRSEHAKDGYIRSDLAAKCFVSLGLGL